MKNTFAKLVSSAAAVAVVTLAAPSAMAGVELVTNGDFSSGLTGWDNQGMSFGNNWGADGSTAAVTGCVGHNCVSTLHGGAYIGQTIATTAGATYNLSFLVGENYGPTSEFSVFWNGSMVADVLNPANFSLNFATNPGMVGFSYNLLADSATTTFEIHGRQDPAGISFDNVSVEQVSGAVPEPASMLLLGIGMLGAFAGRKAAKRK